MIVNQKQLAEVLGITARRVRDLKTMGFFENANNGKGYDLAKCVQEYIEYRVKGEVKHGSSYDKEKEQAEHERVKKDISKLKLRRLKGELHEAADVEAFFGDMLQNFKNTIMAIPAKVAIRLVGEQDVNAIISMLSHEMEDTLDQLSQYDPDDIDDEVTLFDEDEDEIDED